ncbi:hypothetical protein LSTR_LSTR005808 [Laodelphax striatellus]|uniref:Uncharacterized protein n=1 Tax=Laodelphax striatellus TaxID=195883 RepID=A0A482WRW5_LAOST|nr:hypothetical protein LSTR_LSTR005808 [Laodelphax striatellus]
MVGRLGRKCVFVGNCCAHLSTEIGNSFLTDLSRPPLLHSVFVSHSGNKGRQIRVRFRRNYYLGPDRGARVSPPRDFLCPSPRLSFLGVPKSAYVFMVSIPCPSPRLSILLVEQFFSATERKLKNFTFLMTQRRWKKHQALITGLYILKKTTHPLTSDHAHRD